MQDLKGLAADFHNPPLERPETCETHGEYTAFCHYRNSWHGCPQCREIKLAAAKEQSEQSERKQREHRYRIAIGNAGIPERFRGRTLETYCADSEKQARILSFCRSYADDFAEVAKTGRNILMLGLPGTGKTHLSIGIALEIMRDGRTSVFTTASRLLRSIKDTYSKRSEVTESQAIAVFTNCDLLIVDEVGVQRGSEYEKDTLFDVINERYENLRPTIILSNLTTEEIRAYLGDRVYDRLRENGGKAFVFDWDSYRGKAA